MLRSIAPKVASAAAAVAAASSSHGNVALTDFQPSLAGREVVSYGKNSGSSSRSDISDGWNFIHNGSSSFMVEKPSIEEAEEATVAVFKALGAGAQKSSTPSWPDADASMEASESAISAANEVLHSSLTSCGNPASSTASQVFLLIKNRPQETRQLVEALVQDSNVWDAFTQNPAFQTYVSDAARPEPRGGSNEHTSDPDSITEIQESVDNLSNHVEKGKLEGVVQKMIAGVQSFMHDIGQFFMDLFKTGDDKKPRNGLDDTNGTFVGVALLVLVVIGVIFVRRV